MYMTPGEFAERVGTGMIIVVVQESGVIRESEMVRQATRWTVVPQARVMSVSDKATRWMRGYMTCCCAGWIGKLEKRCQ